MDKEKEKKGLKFQRLKHLQSKKSNISRTPRKMKAWK